ncbi:MAG: carboxymuconolactone decarboxylase [Chitinophagaceae bacterium BSSC1]|jgi:quercetin dioxygenase-like cupin family protein/alkylhydroperoxidase/carboxymuconolactone decarboxylase family protein YurZ|nr:MAG: carboxymuconolactone decarboxylase [Chitinophagaceae bacterium BSSC1]
MKKNTVLISILILMNLVCYSQLPKDSSSFLTSKERSMVVIAGLTAQGNIVELKDALSQGLNAGLSISEVKEMLVQLYAYTGFPRSLNALNCLMGLVNERKANGIQDLEGKQKTNEKLNKPLIEIGTENQTKLVGNKISGGVYDFAPTIDQYLKEHLFGAIFGNDILDWKTRELITISALASLKGTEPQLRSHLGVGMYNGLTTKQLSEILHLVEKSVHLQQGIIAKKVFQSLLDKKPYQSEETINEIVFPKGQKINSDNFSGIAWLQQLIMSDSSNGIQVGSVTFEPGARTKWHYHPSGQILLAIDGLGYYQEKGSPKRLIRKGETVKCPANKPHWHGASPNQVFVQIAITDSKKGGAVWLEQVSDLEYF